MMIVIITIIFTSLLITFEKQVLTSLQDTSHVQIHDADLNCSREVTWLKATRH